VKAGVLGRQLIPILSTGAYTEGWPVIGYVAVGVLFCGYAQIVSRLFFFRKQTLTPLFIYGSAAGANILLNVLLIPRFGYMAAAWSTVASYVLLLLIVALVATRSSCMGFSFRPCFRMAGSALFKHNDAMVDRWRWHGGNLGAGSGKRVDMRYESRIVEGLLRRYGLEKLFPGPMWKKGKGDHASALAHVSVAEILAGYGDTTGAIAHLVEGEEIPSPRNPAGNRSIAAHRQGESYNGKYEFRRTFARARRERLRTVRRRQAFRHIPYLEHTRRDGGESDASPSGQRSCRPGAPRGDCDPLAPSLMVRHTRGRHPCRGERSDVALCASLRRCDKHVLRQCR